ncbi:MAG: prepilin-type N-terminal cleavage/methylation domain-containing protein [Rhodospirillales bacterium]|nr:prepilin-type N-terminal cleavage/methylation domain-containing protein [Rhodospirillales bacterium]
MILDKYNQRGFTLIEVAILLIVVSVLLLPFIQEYRAYINTKAKFDTNNNQSTVEFAISQFYEKNGFYPCPDRQSPIVALDDPAFGVESCPLPTDPEGMDESILVLRGFVPTKALEIEAKYALDGWGNRMSYVVTKKLVRGFFDASAGTNPMGAITEISVEKIGSTQPPSVDILDITASPPVYPGIQSGHAFLISHGPSGGGGYSRDGTLIAACPADGESHDKENCDDDALIYSNSLGLDTTNLPGPDFYDDIVMGVVAGGSRKWSYSQQDKINTYSGFNIVGINEDMPMSDLLDAGGNKKNGIDVNGEIKVESTTDPQKKGQVKARVVCNKTGNVPTGDNHCFDPAMIAGAGVDCPGSIPIIGLADNQAYCFNYVPLVPRNCPLGEYVVGVDGDGNLICETR